MIIHNYMRLLFYISYTSFVGEFTKIEQGSHHTLLTTNEAFFCQALQKLKKVWKNAEWQKNAEQHSG